MELLRPKVGDGFHRLPPSKEQPLLILARNRLGAGE
jgi:hypothetical protein